jgi:parallel beta-helix repeat protein
VTIENGTIREFATALFVLGGTDNRIRALSSADNILGGMVVIAAANPRIESNSITRNGLFTDQAGLIVFNSTDVRVESNSIFANGDIGMFLLGLDSARIEKNSVQGNPESGVVLDGTGNELSRNRLADNGDNINLTGDNNTVTENLVVDATGCDDGCGFGIFVEGGSGNLIADNNVARTARAGIRLDAFAPPVDGNVFRDNIVRDAGTDGIAVNEEHVGDTGNTLIEGNITLRAADDGIDVESPTTTLTENIANGNGDLGIEADPGVIDGGGNHANANGNPAQCQGVVCS